MIPSTGRQPGPGGSLSFWSWHSSVVTNSCQLQAQGWMCQGGPMSWAHFHTKKVHSCWWSPWAEGFFMHMFQVEEHSWVEVPTS